MPAELFRATLEKRFELLKSAIGVSIAGLGSADATVTQEGQVHMLIEPLTAAQNLSGAACFTSIEPTKATDAKGLYALAAAAATREKLAAAESVLDNFALSLSNAGCMEAFIKPGQSICHINCCKAKKMGACAEGLTTKRNALTMITASKKGAPSPCRNAWKRQPLIKCDSANFPEMQTKKPRTDNDASAKASAAALTGKRAELDSRRW